MQKTILKPFEIPSFSGMVNLPLAVCQFRQLKNLEEYEFRRALGTEFRGVLLEALADYSAAVFFTPGTYSQDAVVKYQTNGVPLFYKAKSSTTNIPTTAADWSLAPKFDAAKTCGAAFENLWCEYLGEWLALSVVIKRLPFLNVQITDAGLLQYDGQNYKTAEEKDNRRLMIALESSRNIVFSNMAKFLIANKSEPCFSTIDFDGTKGCNYGLANFGKVYGRSNRNQYKIG